MTATVQADRSVFGSAGAATSPRIEGLPDEFAGPIIAGAFARGIAETFNLLGVSGFFFDREGHVLFASTAAEAFLSKGLVLRAGHLLAKSRADNAALADFVADILRDPAARQSVTLARSGLTMTSLPVPGGLPPSDQLLHAIVVLGDAA